MIGLAHPDNHQESSIWHELPGKPCTKNIPTIYTKTKSLSMLFKFIPSPKGPPNTGFDCCNYISSILVRHSFDNDLTNPINSFPHFFSSPDNSKKEKQAIFSIFPSNSTPKHLKHQRNRAR